RRPHASRDTPHGTATTPSAGSSPRPRHGSAAATRTDRRPLARSPRSTRPQPPADCVCPPAQPWICRARKTDMSVSNVQGLAIAIALLVFGRALVALVQYVFGVGQ